MNNKSLGTANVPKPALLNGIFGTQTTCLCDVMEKTNSYAFIVIAAKLSCLSHIKEGIPLYEFYVAMDDEAYRLGR